MKQRSQRGGQGGVALLMVVSFVAMMAIILVDFSTNTHMHLSAGVNVRDDIRASTLGDTALVMTRSCLDPKSWGPLGTLQNKMDLERLCNLLLGIFIQGRIDLPVGGLSIELEGVEGVGLGKGEIESMELIPEESFLSIAGLHCGKRGNHNCATRRTSVRQLRSLFCDPLVAEVFEKEQADGHRYTRAEVIGNIIDWMDTDDNRIYIDPNTWQLAEGTGEGEDSYLKEGEQRYRSKDAPFDSIEELRLVRGIDDRLFAFIRDKVSVHSMNKVNVNKANVDVIAALLQAQSANFQLLEMSACGQESDTPQLAEDIFRRYAQMIIDVRNMKSSLLQYALSKPYKQPQHFVRDAQDPLAALEKYMGQSFFGNSQLFDPQQVAMRYGMDLNIYQMMLAGLGIDWAGVQRSVGTQNNIYRLRVKARVGNMTRSLFAILKRDGVIMRTLYYRED